MMVEDYQINSIHPDVRWPLIAALGSLALLTLIIILCAKKDKKESKKESRKDSKKGGKKDSKKKEKRKEESNGMPKPAHTEKDVGINIFQQFATTETINDQAPHNYENTQIPNQPQHQLMNPPNHTPVLSNNNAQRHSYYEIQQVNEKSSKKDREKDRDKDVDKNSKKNGTKKTEKKEKKEKKEKDKKDKDKKNKEERKASDKIHSAETVEKREKDQKDREKEGKEKKAKKKSAGSFDNIEVPVPVGVPMGAPPGALTLQAPTKPPPTIAAEFKSLPLPSKPLNISELDSYLREAQKTGEITKQYKAIPRSMGFTTEDSERPEHREKNRYRNIVPYDYNRVKLDLIPGDPNSDYINASLIDVTEYGCKKQYIASQGPIEPTINDFWRMIWEHKVTVVVMVTNPWERGMKCLMYWPEGTETSTNFGDIELVLEKKNVLVLPDYTVRKITATKGSEQRLITQLQFRTWPDHGVPRHAMALLNFRDKVREEVEHITTPIVIHCSAGVGRTGTFLAIDQLLEQAEIDKKIDVPACVCRLRRQRSDLVQTVEQYGFIYQAVLERLVLGQTTIPCFKFEKMYNELLSNDKGQKSKLTQQFEMLDQFMAEKPGTSNLIALEEENRSKNRSSKIIPTDEVRRVKLLSQLDGHSNYINAVFADGHRRAGSFIATEMPMVHTMVDFWRMIHEYQCSILIMLTPVKSVQIEDLYFPLKPGENFKMAPFEITCVEKKKFSGLEIRKLKMVEKKEEKEIYHMTLSTDLQMNANELLEQMQALYQKIMRRQQSHKDTAGGLHARPIVAHCQNGVQWTGFLIVLCHLFDQINNDQEVDIFNAVRQSRLSRPQFINSEEQYIMLHDIVKLYIDSFETYSNFK